MNKLNVVNEHGGISAHARPRLALMRENLLFERTLVHRPPVQTLGVG